MRNAFFAAVKWEWSEVSFFMQSAQTQLIDNTNWCSPTDEDIPLNVILIWFIRTPHFIQPFVSPPICWVPKTVMCLQEGGLTFDLSLIDCLLFDLKRDDGMPFECFTACETLILMLMPSTCLSSHTHTWRLFPVCPLWQACHGCHRSLRQLGEWSEYNKLQFYFIMVLLLLYCCSTFYILFYCNIAYQWL